MSSEEIQQIIIRAGRNIISEIGLGHSEMIYQKCLQHYLRNLDFKVEIEKTYPVIFDDIQVGFCRPDLVISNQDYVISGQDHNNIILEIKTTLTLSKQAKAQLQKYEKYSNLSFLVNFPPQVGTTDIEIFKQERNTNLN